VPPPSSPPPAAEPAGVRRVVVWNVQRLFHPRGSPLSRALDATEAQGWTKAAYTEKIARVAAVLRDACGGLPPALLALVEVEDAAVVRDLLRATGWDSLADVTVANEDVAGYDIALAYDRALLGPAGEARSYNIHNRYSTRDVLEVPLATPSGARLTVIHNHWPSRMLSGAEALRIGAADYVSRLVERRLKVQKEDLFTARGTPQLPAHAVLEERWNEPLLVLGDFNDNPFDTSLRLLADSTRERAEVLKRPRLPATRGAAAVAAYLTLRPRLYNPSWALLGGPESPSGAVLGTHRYGRDWYLLDQVLCSRGLLAGGGAGSGPSFVEGSLRVHAPAQVMVGGRRVQVRSKGGEPLAYDAKRGTGVSDHFPVVAELRWPA
jgi:endonuclease/exonuclease/phosphatase family metal-dependent hydrolase